MRTINLCIALLWLSFGISQNYKADLKTNTKKGLHRVLLTPDFRAFAEENFDGIRIHDTKNNTVPYVIIRNTDRLFSEFKPLKLVSKTILKDSVTSIVIDAQSKRLDHLALRISNTKINKNYNIYGSDNGNDWFGILEQQRLNTLLANDTTYVEQKIELPLNNYPFLKIDINDKTSSPINVIALGTLTNRFLTSTPIALNSYVENTVLNNDRTKTTLFFKALNAYKVDLIDFDIKTDYFKRDAQINTSFKNDKGELHQQNMTRFQLNSNRINTFSTANLKAATFSVAITNNDDAPLDIKAIKLYQNPIYLVANLKANENYTISIDHSLKSPNYDLKYFVSNKTKVISEAKISNLKPIKNTAVTNTETPFWQTSLFMWICISIGSLFAAYFAVKLIKDVK